MCYIFAVDCEVQSKGLNPLRLVLNFDLICRAGADRGGKGGGGKGGGMHPRTNLETMHQTPSGLHPQLIGALE